ncbi:MAG: hypothetical protein K0S38_1102, partial [Candidatus Paceibacter sp.]|nr:hypothetical protein [Candidatus Paceibacter sp.]
MKEDGCDLGEASIYYCLNQKNILLCKNAHTLANVAQLVEHAHGKGEVAGSIPAIGSRRKFTHAILYSMNEISLSTIIGFLKKAWYLYNTRRNTFLTLGGIVFVVSMLQVVAVKMQSMLLFGMSV